MKSTFFESFLQSLSGSDLYIDPELKKQSNCKESLNQQSDLENLRGDWQKIGSDFRIAIRKLQPNAR